MDALLRADDDIWNALSNIAPATDKTQQSINFLIDIFKGQAKENKYGTANQRVFMEAAQAQRVVADEAEQMIGVSSEEMIIDNDYLITTKELKL